MSLLRLIANLLLSLDGSPAEAKSSLPDKAAEKEKEKFDLCKMEYEKCAGRYEDIYKAIWTQFNYYAVIAGAILTFGKETLGPLPSGLLACLTLIFWYRATFVPLNRYGDSVASRLTEIEHYFRVNVFDKKPLAVIESPPELKIEGFTPREGIYHFTDYGKWKDAEGQKTEKANEAQGTNPVTWVVIFIFAVGVTALEFCATGKVTFRSLINRFFFLLSALLINGLAVFLVCRLFRNKESRVRDAVNSLATLLNVIAVLLSFVITYRLLNHLPLK